MKSNTKNFIKTYSIVIAIGLFLTVFINWYFKDEPIAMPEPPVNLSNYPVLTVAMPEDLDRLHDEAVKVCNQYKGVDLPGMDELCHMVGASR